MFGLFWTSFSWVDVGKQAEVAGCSSGDLEGFWLAMDCDGMFKIQDALNVPLLPLLLGNFEKPRIFFYNWCSLSLYLPRGWQIAGRCSVKMDDDTHKFRHFFESEH